MRKMLKVTSMLVASTASVFTAYAQLNLLGVGGDAAFSTWNSTLNTSQLTYSNGNDTVQCSNCAGNQFPTIGTNTHTSGKFYMEFTATAIGGCCTEVGLVNTIFSTAPGNTPDGGNQGAGVGWNITSGTVKISNASIGTATAVATGNVVGIAVDIGNSLIWTIVCTPTCGNWNNNAAANPVTGSGGWSLSTLGNTTLNTAYVDGFGSSTIVLNTGVRAFTNTVPSGFSVWH